MIELDIICYKCSRLLAAKFAIEDKRTAITISPCLDCLYNEYERGVIDGTRLTQEDE